MTDPTPPRPSLGWGVVADLRADGATAPAPAGADHALPGGRFADTGLCQACAEPWPCPTERIRRSLARMDAATTPSVQRLAALLAEHHLVELIDGFAGGDHEGWACEGCDWNDHGDGPLTPGEHAAHQATLADLAGLVRRDAPDAERLALGTSTGPTGTPGGST